MWRSASTPLASCNLQQKPATCSTHSVRLGSRHTPRRDDRISRVHAPRSFLSPTLLTSLSPSPVLIATVNKATSAQSGEGCHRCPVRRLAVALMARDLAPLRCSNSNFELSEFSIATDYTKTSRLYQDSQQTIPRQDKTCSHPTRPQSLTPHVQINDMASNPLTRILTIPVHGTWTHGRRTGRPTSRPAEMHGSSRLPRQYSPRCTPQHERPLQRLLSLA